MIADCETCDRKQVPCSQCETSQRRICFVCQGDECDPYGELPPTGKQRCSCGTKPKGSYPDCASTKRRATVTIFVPDGYADAGEFLKDCQFERPIDPLIYPGARTDIAIGLWHKFANASHIEWENESHKAEYLAAVDGITTAQLFNLLLTRIDFDGMDPRTFLLGELERAIKGAAILRPKAAFFARQYVTRDDLRILSLIFNEREIPIPHGTGFRINEWLKAQIAAASPSPPDTAVSP